MWRLWWKDTQLCFGKIKQTAAFLPKMAQHRIPRHSGGAKARMNLHRSDSDSRHQNRRHIRPEHCLCHLVTMTELTCPKLKVWHPDMCISILLFPARNFSIMMYMPRIASAIKILIQICWLIKEHPLVCTLSAVWYCSWHPFCRWQQPIEGTWQWRWALIEWNRFLECIIIYN